MNNNRCNTINNYINNNWYKKTFEKTPKHINIKKNSYINSSGKGKQTKSRINNIIKINSNNKYELGEEKIKFKKGHKYQIAIKEFLNLVQNSNTNNKMSNSGNNSPNKDFLPYL